MDAQLQIRQNALEAQDYMQDLMSWTQTMNQKAGIKAGKQQTDQGVPSVRGKADGCVQSAPENLQRPALQPTTPSSAVKPPPAAHTYTHYSKWDKFNADAASDEEEQPSRKQQHLPTALNSKPQQPAPPRPLQQAATAANGSSKSSAASTAVPPQAAPSATALKDRGNKLFQAGYFNDAINCYTQSIGLQPTAVAYANRAMAHLKLSRCAEAEQDCNAALQLDSTYIKALHRRGTARRQLGRSLEAAIDFEEALRLEPGNATVQADRDAALQQYLQQQKIQSSGVWSSIPVVQQQQKEQQQQQQLQVHKTLSSALLQPQQQQQQICPQSKTAFSQPDVPQSARTISAQVAAAPRPEGSSSTAMGATADATCKLPSSDVTVASAAINAMSSAANKVEANGRSRHVPAARPPPSRSPSPQQLSTAAAAAAAAQLAARRAASLKAPSTSNDFEAAWRSLKGDQRLQAKYLALIDPPQLPAIFKTSLTAPILSAILCTALEAMSASHLDAHSDAADASGLTAAHAVALIEHMVTVPRFDMTAMCLTGKNKAPLKQSWDAAACVCEAKLAERLAAVRPKYRL